MTDFCFGSMGQLSTIFSVGKTRFRGLAFCHHEDLGLRSKKLLLQHVFELSEPSREDTVCPALCVGYKSETVVALSKGRSCISTRIQVNRPLQLVKAPVGLSDIQRHVLTALMPVFCLPYARAVLKDSNLDWLAGFLLAWGKVAAWKMRLELMEMTPDGGAAAAAAASEN
eukprot:TRINITY_DN22587_c1_g1_i3.p1 TRINITY_DN22587_c1_g1~~TRINITY_DN22587_c1_g1_i3.p1  ORF type:complete len:170 (+),score=30.60 TRINITY_DN22587_c1_g1_i3:173-682(+)